MGESKTNLNSLLRDTLPAFPPLNRDGVVEIGLRAVPKRNVYLTTPGVETDPQSLAKHAELCKEMGRDQVIHPLGQPLGTELCDIVLVMMSGWVDTAASPPTVGRFFLPGEILRTDMNEFLEHAERSIEGGSRIIKPALTLATH